MSYIVCCPIAPSAKLHMSFSRIFDDKKVADEYCSKLKKERNIVAPFTKPYGPRSMLYDVSHPMYCNDRPPHVAGGPSETITVCLNEAYVHKINTSN